MNIILNNTQFVEFELLQKIPSINYFSNIVLNHLNYKKTKEEINKIKLKEEKEQLIKDSFLLPGKDTDKLIKQYIKDYFSLIKDKNNVELDENNFENYPLDYFIIVGNDKNYLLEIYNNFIQAHNTFISTIEKSKIHEDLKIIDEIYIQDAKESDIPKYSENKLIEIIINNSEINFDENNNIKFDDNYICDYDEIEKNLGKIMYSGIKKFISRDIGIRKFKYKDEYYNDLNDDILYDFKKKYMKNELAKNELSENELTEKDKEKIEKYMEEKKKEECKSFLLSLQFLMHHILSNQDYLKNEDDIYNEVIDKMPIANLEQSQKQYYELIKSFFYSKKDIDDEEDLLEQMNNDTSIENYTIEKLYYIFLKAKKIYDKKFNL